MKKAIVLLALAMLWVMPQPTHAADLRTTLSGRILLQVETYGQAWYVNPLTKQRHFLGRPDDAFAIMRELGLGIKHTTLTTYLRTGFPLTLSGRIMLDVENHGEAYYVSPVDRKGYFLGRPADAFALMRAKGLGITDANIMTIPVAPKYAFFNERASYSIQKPTHWIYQADTNPHWTIPTDYDGLIGEDGFADRSTDTYVALHKIVRDVDTTIGDESRVAKNLMTSAFPPTCVFTYTYNTLTMESRYGVSHIIAKCNTRVLTMSVVQTAPNVFFHIISSSSPATFVQVQPTINKVVTSLIDNVGPMAAPNTPQPEQPVTTSPTAQPPITTIHTADTANPVTTMTYTTPNFSINYQSNWTAGVLSRDYVTSYNTELQQISTTMTEADIADYAAVSGLDPATVRQQFNDATTMRATDTAVFVNVATANMAAFMRIETSLPAYDFLTPTTSQMMAPTSPDFVILHDTKLTISGKPAREIMIADPINTNEQVTVLIVQSSPQSCYVGLHIPLDSAALTDTTFYSSLRNSLSIIK